MNNAPPVEANTNLHTAICNAVMLLNQVVHEQPESRQAHEILRQALVDYADFVDTPDSGYLRGVAAAAIIAEAQRDDLQRQQSEHTNSEIRLHFQFSIQTADEIATAIRSLKK